MNMEYLLTIKMNRTRHMSAALIGLAMVGLTSGCATETVGRMSMSGAEPIQSAHWTGLRQDASNQEQADAMQGSDPEPGATIVRGSDRMFNPAGRAVIAPQVGPEVVLRFDQAPVTDVVHAVLGDILGLPYVVNQPVSGSLTINTSRPLPREEVLPVLEAVLQANGLSMAVDSSGVYHVGRPESLRGVNTFVGTATGVLAPGSNLMVLPLQYIGAAEMADILKPLANPENIVRVDSVRNLIILAGSKSRLEGFSEIVSMFDVDMLKGMSVGLFPMKYASVMDVEQAIKAVMAEGATAAGDTGGSGGRVSMGPLAGVLRIFPLEKANALLVVTPRSHYLDHAREWIDRFDQPQGEHAEQQLYVYSVQNGAAGHLSTLLSALFSGSGTSRQSGAVSRDSGVAPGLSASSLGSVSGTTTPSAGGDRSSISQISIGDDVRVVADEVNNSLLIYAPRSEYRKIEAALRRLDIAPTQVLIEASILEVTLTDELSYGLQWYFNGGVGGGYSGAGRLSGANNGAIAASFPGFGYTVTNPVDQVKAVLNAFAQKSLINVISSPSIMVQDNHTATIQVGDQQPVRSSTTVTDGGTTTSSIQFKDTGVQLAVTPSVNAGDLVTMDIKQTVTDVGQVDLATGQRSFLQRQIESKVAVRSGESIVLGGLIKDNTTRSRQGLPVLQDVPLLGNLFSSTADNGTRTELLVMITPRVIRSEVDLRLVGDELRQRMRGLDMLTDRIGASYSATQAGVVESDPQTKGAGAE